MFLINSEGRAKESFLPVLSDELLMSTRAKARILKLITETTWSFKIINMKRQDGNLSIRLRANA